MKPNVHNCERGKTLGVAMRITLIALLLASLVRLTGCTSRKQYSINESVLIGERRQLEDEIYRMQFELRDALDENQRLRARLEKNGGARANDARRLNSTTPQRADAQQDVDDERFFPGGDALRTGDRSANEIETLPDFVPIPNSRASASSLKRELTQANYVDVAPPRVMNATEAARDAADEIDDGANYDDEDEDEIEWTPIS